MGPDGNAQPGIPDDVAPPAGHVQLVSSPDGRVLWISPAVTAVLEWQPTDILGHSSRRIVHPEDAEPLDAERAAAIDPEDRPDDHRLPSVRVRTKTGHYLAAVARLTPIAGPAGTPLGVVITFDVDGVAGAEAPTTGSSADSECAALDSVLDPLVTFEVVTDETGQTVDFEYVDANQAACNYIQVPLARLIGTSLLERFPGVDLLGLFSACAGVHTSGIPLTVSAFAIEAGDFNGRYDIAVTPTAAGVTVAWRDAEVIESHVGVDLQAEAGPVPSDPWLWATASDVVAFSDCDGAIEWISDGVAELTGWTARDIVGQRLQDLVHPFDAAEVFSNQEAVRNGEPTRFEARFQTRSGAYRWLSYSVWSLLDAAGVNVGRVAHISDAMHESALISALAGSAARIEAASRASAAGMCLVSPDGRFLEVNPALCELVHTSAPELLRQRWPDIIHPDDLYLDLDVVAAVRRGERDAYQSTVRLITATGATLWVELAVGVVRNRNGSIRYYVTQLVDITDQVQSREALAHSERMLRLVIDSSPDAIVQYDRQLRVEFANPRAQVLSAVPTRDWSGLTNREFGLQASLAHRWDDHLRHVVASGRASRLEDVVGVGSEARWYDVWLTPDTDAAGRVQHVILTARDVTGAKAIESRLLQAATHDSLTGLANRSALHEELHRALAASGRSRRPVGILAIDLDHFKNINDALGHLSGDSLLMDAAARIVTAARDSDLVARLGGDEFVVVLRDVTDSESVCAVAQRVVEAFRQPFDVIGVEMYATASIGVAISTASATSEDLLREADTALYLAKARGRDCVAVYNEELHDTVTERVRLETEFRTAVTQHGLSVWFQPEVDIVTGQLVGAEALLRWRRNDGNISPADDFIHVAEETGLILDVGAWVFREACRFAAEMQQKHAEPFFVRSNVSAHQLVNAAFIDQVDAALVRSGADPTCLTLEITETALLGATPTVHMNLDGLHSRGIAIAIDDFGTGYGSLTYLRQFPISAIKLDRTFVTGIVDDERDRSLVRAMISLAKEFELDVVAEGVETHEQEAVLLELGCRRAQGFLYSQARPSSDFLPDTSLRPA